MPKLSRREQELKDISFKVIAALDEGKMTRSDICEATGMKMYELNSFFSDDRETFAKYKIRRKTLTDIAADNIVDIINDPKHPKHYDASKYVLQNYKSDLDGILESEDTEIVIDNLPSKAKSSVKIVFSKGD